MNQMNMGNQTLEEKMRSEYVQYQNSYCSGRFETQLRGLSNTYGAAAQSIFMEIDK